MEKAQVNNNGIGFLGLLTIVFITLKLTKVIDWSWWLVTAPIWMPVVLFTVVLFIALLIDFSFKKRPTERPKNAESKFEVRMREMMEKQRALNKNK